MNLPMFDQKRENELSSYGESVRLSNEVRAVQAHQETLKIINIFGKEEEKTFNIPAKNGFDVETADYSEFVLYLNDTTIKKSESKFWFMIRIMCVRFPEKHSEIRANLNSRHHLEFDLVLSQMKNEIEWVGTVGYQNMVRLDKSLDSLRTKVIKLNNDEFKIVRI